jgi:hypothetical protein
MTAVRTPRFAFDAEVQRLGADLSSVSAAESLVPHMQGAEIRTLLNLTHPVERHRASIEPIVSSALDYVGDHKEHILWPFARPSASRFSDGSYGVLYAGLNFETALAEVVYWAAKIFADANAPAGAIARKQHLSFRATSDEFADMRLASAGDPTIYDPNDYSMSRRVGSALHGEGLWGVYYDSVRHAGSSCIGAFVPRTASNVNLRDLIEFTWDGARISKWGTVNSL